MSHGSQQSHSFYVDDIPVVMTEKWRLPPLPNISKELVQSFYQGRAVDDDDDQGRYTFTLEQKVLAKIDEWKTLREQELSEREERMRAREVELQRQLEAEETRLKERLTQICYPSPDDFSSSSDDEQPDETKAYQGTFFDSILKPTVIQARPESASDQQLRVKKSQTSSLWATGKENVNKLELADFENDAPDPFYNVELKTIDDLDVLAQVLQSSHMLHSKEVRAEAKKAHAAKRAEEKASPSVEKGNVDQGKSELADKEQAVEQPPPPQGVINGFRATASPSSIAPQPYQDLSYAPNYSSYYVPSNQQASLVYAPAANGGYTTGGYSFNQSSLNNYGRSYASDYSAYLSSPYANNRIDYQFNSQQQQQPNQMVDPGFSPPAPGSLAQSKLKSKSVPDIVQELENEVKDSERRRARNNSQSAETARNTINNAKAAAAVANNSSEATKINSCDELLKTLPIEIQKLINNISQMGFPVDRVFRVAEQFQGDDKKVGLMFSQRKLRPMN